MDKRLSFPEGEHSSTDMQDLSISSIISNVSKLLEGNNSSFLVHVDSSLAKEETFVSSDEAMLLLDKEEEERERFLKSPNASFASSTGRHSEQTGTDVLSMTNYFQCRSSFPVDNIANESSMFNENLSLHPADSTIQPNVSDCNNSNDVTVTHRFMPDSLEMEVSDSCLIMTPPPMANLDSKTKSLADFLMGSQSNGLQKTSIMDYVLDICKRRSSYGIGTNILNPNSIEPSHASSGSIIEMQLPDVQEIIQINRNVENKIGNDQEKILVSHADIIKEKSDKHVSTKLKNVDPRVAKKTTRNSEPSSNKISKVRFSRDLEQYSTKKGRYRPAPVGNDVDRSILVSKPGKVALCDDIDVSTDGFDDFKRHLSNLEENTISRPVSAFVHPVSAIKISSNEPNKPEIVNRRSVSAEHLRKAALSPPEKLISKRSSNINGHQSTSINFKAAQPNQNHSTPVGNEPLSTQMARLMRRESFRSVEVIRSATRNDVNITSSQPHPRESSVDVQHKISTSTQVHKTKESHLDASHPSTTGTRNYVSSIDNHHHQNHVHAHNACAYPPQQNAPGWSGYGMPISIHIHLPEMPFPNHQHGHHPTTISSATGYPNTFQGPFSSMCNCHSAPPKK